MAGMLLVSVLLDGRKTDLEHSAWTRHQDKVFTRGKQWRREDAARKSIDEEAARRGQRDVEKAFGGALSLATRNPDLTLREMIEQTARACAPPEFGISVHVDRFTEFEVLVHLPRSPERATVANFSRCLLQHCATYVHSIRFALNGKVGAELDRRAIESVADWSAVNVSDVESLFVETEAPPGSETKESISGASRHGSDLEELTGDARRLATVAANLKQSHQRAADSLKVSIDSIESAVSLTGVSSAADLQSKLRVLDQTARDIESWRAFHLQSGEEYLRLLKAENLDPLLILILARCFNERSSLEMPHVNRLRAALLEHRRQCRGLIETMLQHWGHWSVDGTTQRIRFESSTSHDAHEKASRRMESSGQAVMDAIRTLTEWRATQADEPQG